MSHHFPGLLCLALATLSSGQAVAARAPSKHGETTIYPATVLVARGVHFTRADAVAIRNGRLLAVGQLADVLRAAGSDAALDHSLADKVLVAGLVDRHVPPLLAALALQANGLGIESAPAPQPHHGQRSVIVERPLAVPKQTTRTDQRLGMALSNWLEKAPATVRLGQRVPFLVLVGGPTGPVVWGTLHEGRIQPLPTLAGAVNEPEVSLSWDNRARPLAPCPRGCLCSRGAAAVRAPTFGGLIIEPTRPRGAPKSKGR